MLGVVVDDVDLVLDYYLGVFVLGLLAAAGGVLIQGLVLVDLRLGVERLAAEVVEGVVLLVARHFEGISRVGVIREVRLTDGAGLGGVLLPGDFIVGSVVGVAFAGGD